jgi:hypothetical protein
VLDDSWGIRVFCTQIDEAHAIRSCLRRVGTLAPINQEGHQPVPQPHVGVRQPPSKHLTAAELTPTASHFAEGEPGVPGRGSPMVQVRVLDCPGYEARPRESIETKPTWLTRLCLARIGSDELQIHGRPQANEGIARAFTRVTAPRHCPNPCQALEAFDLVLEIRPAPDEVIDGRQPSRLGRVDMP